MELVFHETLKMRLAGNKNALKALAKEPWNAFTGDFKECPGCSRCIQCRYKDKARRVTDAYAERVLNRRETNLDGIKRRQTENEEKTEEFYKKFGHLKKACVLLHYGRANDAFLEICLAGKKKNGERESVVDMLHAQRDREAKK